MRVALDTNRLTDVFKDDPALLQFLGRCEEIWVPLPTLAELKVGFLGGSGRHHNESLLYRFLGKATVDVLLPDRETADHYASIHKQLRLAGRPIPINDVWIAALALQHNLTLVTRDAHFKHIPILQLQS